VVKQWSVSLHIEMLIYILCVHSLSGIIKVVIEETQHQPAGPLNLSLVKASSNIVLLEGINGRHVRLGQIEVERVEVRLDT
jgi:hypothetical protein